MKNIGESVVIDDSIRIPNEFRDFFQGNDVVLGPSIVRRQCLCFYNRRFLDAFMEKIKPNSTFHDMNMDWFHSLTSDVSLQENDDSIPLTPRQLEFIGGNGTIDLLRLLNLILYAWNRDERRRVLPDINLLNTSIQEMQKPLEALDSILKQHQAEGE